MWSSGANLALLDKVPTEKSKYFGIGGTIIFTALMAAFAGGYAFNTAFDNISLSIFFGIFWGALIFNLDRFIVSSFGVGDGKKTISKQELIEASPRLVMAIILGFVISTPLELKLFQKEINAEISTEISITTGTIIKNGENDPVLVRLRTELNELNNNITSRLQLIEEKRAFWEKASKDKNDEWNTGKFSGKVGKGGYFEDLKKVADNAETEYNQIKVDYSALNQKDYAKLDKINSDISEREKMLRESTERQKTVQAQNDGLMARLKALNKLSQENFSLLFAKWLITLLFIFIEIAPVMFKMMTERGPYDDMVDRLKHEIKVKELLAISNINEEVNTLVSINREKSAQKLNAELSANNHLLNTISEAQAEIAREAINEWKRIQLEAVIANPGILIKDNLKEHV
jgi:hypothetical protein